jgi:hypothetical protein
LQKVVQVCVVGKVFQPKRRKVLALSRVLSEFFGLVEWSLHFNSTLKSVLRENGYEVAKERFTLNTALVQTARDRAVGIL